MKSERVLNKRERELVDFRTTEIKTVLSPVSSSLRDGYIEGALYSITRLFPVSKICAIY